ncbi:hypothetical protein [Streptomyces hirsutus]|uniref:hypothetical protein n=1 Tax=Streptomyces hirsutus TaxID=35620 RepID=UPI000A5792AB|nr:hypothetical protein [Streptomyces hirsutus]
MKKFGRGIMKTFQALDFPECADSASALVERDPKAVRRCTMRSPGHPVTGPVR